MGWVDIGRCTPAASNGSQPTGLRLAEATGLPHDVLERAHTISKDLKKRVNEAKEKSQGTRLSRKKAVGSVRDPDAQADRP